MISSTFGQLTDDGSTAAGCWIYTGSYTDKNNMARRDTADPSGLGITPSWGWAWPLNRRILYNAASCDPTGKPGIRAAPSSSGTARSGWGPTYRLQGGPAAESESGMSPFIMNPEGMARLFAVDKMAEGRSRSTTSRSRVRSRRTRCTSGRSRARTPPRIYAHDKAALGTSDKFPYAATTYRLTEHFHYWSKHVQMLAVLQPEQFVEIGEELAKEKGIRNGEKIRVRSNRGEIVAKAVVTKRIKPLTVAGKTIRTVGIPIHWGFEGLTKPGYLAMPLRSSVTRTYRHPSSRRSS